MISPRSAELALVALKEVLRLSQHQRNGKPLPADLIAAVHELQAASALERTDVDRPSVVVPAFELVDTHEAARRLGLSVRAVQLRCASGRLPATRIHRTWLVRWESTGWEATNRGPTRSPG